MGRMNPDVFFSTYAPVVQKICKIYGLYPSVCLAQMALESGWGEYTIGEYNFFGRKSVAGDKFIVVPTQEWDGTKFYDVYDEFKDYDSLEEAIEDYCILLTQEPVYMKCLDKLSDIWYYINCMGKVYATDPQYAEKIISTINANDLTQFD